MSKNTLNLLGIVITIVIGTYYYNSRCSACGLNEKKEVETTKVLPKISPHTFSFGDGNYTYSTSDNFNF